MMACSIHRAVLPQGRGGPRAEGGKGWICRQGPRYTTPDINRSPDAPSAGTHTVRPDEDRGENPSRAGWISRRDSASFIKSDGHAGCHITLTASTIAGASAGYGSQGRSIRRSECLSTGTAGKTGLTLSARQVRRDCAGPGKAVAHALCAHRRSYAARHCRQQQLQAVRKPSSAHRRTNPGCANRDDKIQQVAATEGLVSGAQAGILSVARIARVRGRTRRHCRGRPNLRGDWRRVRVRARAHEATPRVAEVRCRPCLEGLQYAQENATAESPRDACRQAMSL